MYVNKNDRFFFAANDYTYQMNAMSFYTINLCTGNLQGTHPFAQELGPRPASWKRRLIKKYLKVKVIYLSADKSL